MEFQNTLLLQHNHPLQKSLLLDTTFPLTGTFKTINFAKFSFKKQIQKKTKKTGSKMMIKQLKKSVLRQTFELTDCRTLTYT